MKVNLIFIKKDGTTEFFILPSSVTLLGRRQDCDFCIPLSCVSRRHCEINLDQGKVTVRDLQSRNGTLINGKRISEASMNAGDVLKIGPIEFVLQIDGVPADLEAYLPEAQTTQASVAESGTERYSTETQEAEYSLDQDLAELDPGRSQTTDFDHGLSGFDLEDDLDMDAEISNL